MESMIIDFWSKASVALRSSCKMLSAFGHLKNLEVRQCLLTSEKFFILETNLIVHLFFLLLMIQTFVKMCGISW